MRTFDIYSTSDFLQVLVTLEEETDRFFKDPSISLQGLSATKLVLHEDLYFKPKFCERIGDMFVYFKGVFLGNGHTITVESERTVPLFSSMYFATIKDLTIFNTERSKSLLLADDTNHSIISGVNLYGSIGVSSNTGGFTKTAQGTTFSSCLVQVDVLSVKSDQKDETGDPLHFGGYVGVSISGNKFNRCVISGKIAGEVAVGGFCAIATDTEFLDCKASDLRILGNREVGSYIGRVKDKVSMLSCEVEEVSVIGKTYLGFIAGKSFGKINVHTLTVSSSVIKPDNVSSYVGGIVGTSDSLEVLNTMIEGRIIANFIVAGLCPDSNRSWVEDTSVLLEITAIGYKPMMVHAYPIVRDKDLSTGKFPIVNTINRTQFDGKLTVIEEGTLNPFEEDML